ncbi:uncharacterized protein [Littorina saxatilis]|uniref:uncharacterized protein n=1 Tax=Littorina saxatilis TaxID=31220 RepID=UPI0038B5F32D
MSCTVLRCHQCGTFQVHQQKKTKKWTCKMCNEKQSFVKVYADGSGAECRSVVQSLNLRRQEVDQLDVHVARQPGAGRVDSVSNLHVHTTALTSDPGQQRGHNSMQATDQKKSKWSPFVEREKSEEQLEADSDTEEENCRTVCNTNPAAQRRHATFPLRSLSAAQRGKPVHKKSSGFFHSTRDRKPSGWTSRQTHSGENHALYGSAQGLPLWDPANVPSREVANVPSRELASVPSRELASVPSRELASVPSRELASVPSRELASVPSRELASVPSRELASVPSRELASVPSRELASVPSRELASVPSRELASVPSRELASVPSRELASVPSRELASVPSRELASVPSREANVWTERDAFPARNGKCVEDTNWDSWALQCRNALGNQSRKCGMLAGGGASVNTSFNPDARQEGSYPADSFQCGPNIATPPVQQSTQWGENSPTEQVTRHDEHSAHRKVSAGPNVSTGSSNTSKWSQYLEAEEQLDDEDAERFDLDATAI